MLAQFFHFLAKASILLYGMNILQAPVWEEPEVQGAIVLSFDDYYLEDWWEARNLLDGETVRATFFISNFELIQEENLEHYVQALAELGHEIGHHTYTHPSLKFFKEEQKESFIKNEIDSLANALGLSMNSFAYPYGHRNTASDNALLKHFYRLRDYRAYPTDQFHAVYPLQDILKLPAIVNSVGIDHTGHTKEELSHLLFETANTYSVVFLTGHRIHTDGRHPWAVTQNTLSCLIDEAKEHKLVFIRFEDLLREEQAQRIRKELNFSKDDFKRLRQMYYRFTVAE